MSAPCLSPSSGLLVLLLVGLVTSHVQAAAPWKPAPGPLSTRWARDVNPERPHPEYPRPQLVREAWLNLNGLWDYAIAPTNAAPPAAWDGQILVPFPVESSLSGVGRRVGPNELLWYRRTFTAPADWAGKRVRLNFGAVDWRTTVWVNGREFPTHDGGYDAFSHDITGALKPTGDQEIVIRVWDPTDAGTQPRGKQVLKPEGIWYTPTSGIWQTVWLEPLAPTHLQDLRIQPLFDQGAVEIAPAVRVDEGPVEVTVKVLDAGRVVAEHREAVPAGTRAALIAPTLTLKLADPKPWSPSSPFLYDVELTVGRGNQVMDRVTSYFGLRKIAVARDARGANRLFLNGQPLFQFGPLDQGFWPDGLYTAPTDEALRYDLEVTRQLGFNMVRKHVKVEPARWYYWCDKMGLLVWQDMPSGERYIGQRDPDIQRSPESGAQFERELQRMIDGLRHHPCIVMWVPYNEGWGQWDTARIVDLVRRWDPTRLVNHASGWTDRGVGDVNDIHVYPGPEAPPLEAVRAGVLGEFGGLGLPMAGHTWQSEKNWGYRSFTNPSDLTEAYLALIRKLHPLTGAPALSAAVYTQTTDVEVEVNGLMTYDRAVMKMDPTVVAAAHRALFTPPAERRAQADTLTPPATPLVACDPYFSIWSPADRLNEEDTVHWTGRPHRLSALVRIDGKAYRLMGTTPAAAPPLPQTGLEVLPTRTLYRFEGAGVTVELTFLTPALPEEIDLLSRPVTYLGFRSRSTDGRAHDVQIQVGASAELVVNTADQAVVGRLEDHGALRAVRLGSVEQAVLRKKGDDLRIDWGYFYLAAAQGETAQATVAGRGALQDTFVRDGGGVPAREDRPAPASDLWAGLTLQSVSVNKDAVERWVLLAYDDLYSIQYMTHPLRPYWRRNGWEATDLLQASWRELQDLRARCEAFDAELIDDLAKAGGTDYARLGALAYRQCFAAGKFVADSRGQPLQFSKENHSNGCIGTSDVFYPMAPQFLLFGPSLAKSFLVPFMNYAASSRWKFPFAPHDLGTYPHANGQVYGGGERTEENQMPVEESGNLLLLMAAVARMEGHAEFAGLYWPQLEQWAEYLKARGFDPENQLCTDDFAGHLAHNVNLSAKAICALGAFGQLCERRGDTARAKEYLGLARELALRWMKEAEDGDHYRLAFNKPGTWSQKYNLVWDRLLGLNLFPPDVARRELAYYRRIQNDYGLPLDNRETYTKLDWILWTATLTRDPEDFQALLKPVMHFLAETPDRSPMTDWYQTKSARKVGFTARPVVGGVFLEALYHADLWKKHAGRDRTGARDWAALPRPPKITPVVAAAPDQAVVWHYTTEKPGPTWFQPGFDDTSWKKGEGGFGTRGTPGSVVRTEWKTSDIWLRRNFDFPAGAPMELVHLSLHHDEEAQVYLNGRLVAEVSGYTSDYEIVPLNDVARAALRFDEPNTLAIHCHQTGGGQYIDAGLVVIQR